MRVSLLLLAVFACSCFNVALGASPTIGTLLAQQLHLLSQDGVPDDSLFSNSCSAQTACSSCTNLPTCGWCSSSSTCLTEVNGAPTSGSCPSINFILMPSGCNDPTPTPDPDISQITLPAAAIGSFIGLGVTTPLMLVLVCLYACRCVRWRPIFGSRLIAGVMAPRDFTTGAMRAIPFLFVLVSLILKLAALGVDVWESDVQPITGGYDLTLWWGLLKMRVKIAGQSGSMSYSDVCSYLGKLDDIDSGSREIQCTSQRIAGILTLVTGILSSVVLLAAVLVGIKILADRASYPRFALRQWRFTGLAYAFSMSAVLYWGISGHLIAHHGDSNAVLGVSWILMIVSFFFDVIAVCFYRQVIRHTIDPSPSNVTAYMTLNAPAAMVPVAIAVNPNYPSQVPQGYGAPYPPQAYPAQQQPQQYAYVPPRYDPPAYAPPAQNPHANPSAPRGF